MSAVLDPFAETPPESVHLPRAPLARVLCQARWPELTQLVQKLDPIAEAVGSDLAGDYPLFSRRHEANFILGPDGITPSQGAAVYQWSTANSQFNVHFSHTFVTVETNQYTSKEDLIARLGSVLDVIARHANIPICSRVGYRYTNQVGAEIDIRPLIKPEVRGGEAIPSRAGVRVVQSVTETLYQIDDDQLLARWARLPAGAVVDPTLDAAATESWVLDLDTFTEGRVPFSSSEVCKVALRLAGRGYTFFRWSVTDEFLETFGGEA